MFTYYSSVCTAVRQPPEPTSGQDDVIAVLALVFVCILDDAVHHSANLVACRS